MLTSPVQTAPVNIHALIISSPYCPVGGEGSTLEYGKQRMKSKWIAFFRGGKIEHSTYPSKCLEAI